MFSSLPLVDEFGCAEALSLNASISSMKVFNSTALGGFMSAVSERST